METETKIIQVVLTPKEAAIVCDALYTTASAYRRDASYKGAADAYDALARRISNLVAK